MSSAQTPSETTWSRISSGMESLIEPARSLRSDDGEGAEEPTNGRGSPAGAGGLPILPARSEPSGEDQVDQLTDLRRFCVGVAEAASGREAVPASTIPALLHAFQQPSRIRHDYPLFIPLPAEDPSAELCQTLEDLLEAGMEEAGFAQAEAKILRDNLSRMERHVRDVLASLSGPTDADLHLKDAGAALLDELDLQGENADQLRTDYERLRSSLPPKGALLGFDSAAPLHLFRAASERRRVERWRTFDERVTHILGGLQARLEVEHLKDPSARAPEKLSEDIGGAASQFLDAGALADVIGPWRGSEPMPRVRRERLEGVLEILTAFGESPPALDEVTLVHDGSQSFVSSVGPEGWRVIEDPDPVGRATEEFERVAERFAALFCAVRIAELELDGRYDPERHDPWFARFDWEAFSKEELLLLPTILCMDTAEHLAEDGLRSLSRLLRSGRPVQVMVLLSPASYPGETVENALATFRLELGYLGIGHREAFVQQSSAARPRHLLEGFFRALSVTRTGLHVVATGLDAQGQQPRLGLWVHAGAALEGRAHPFFRYDPEAGNTWARRFDFGGNPQPEADWPVYPLACRDNDGAETALDLSFTFADFALLEPTLRVHFATIPDDCPDDDLVPVPDYLALPAEDAALKIPFVWAIAEDGRLQRLAVTRKLVLACTDRLGFFHTLQELAGVHNAYVEEATARARENAQAEAAAERDRLLSAHADEVERVRQDAAGEAMQGLARMLLDLDATGLGALPSAPRATAPAPVSAPTEVEEAEAEAPPAVEEEEEEAVSFDEAWIDTPLCTSCNDCTAINPLLFLYDGNKQAYIGDINSGTYAQLVQGAEKCPAKCIHPGKPVNADEPGLDDLIKRAEPFNR